MTAESEERLEMAKVFQGLKASAKAVRWAWPSGLRLVEPSVFQPASRLAKLPELPSRLLRELV